MEPAATLAGPFSQHTIDADRGLLFVDAQLAVGASASIILRRQGQAVPDTVVPVRAMLDTGSDRSIVTPAVAARFGRLPVSCIFESLGLLPGRDQPAHEFALQMPDGGVFRSVEMVVNDRLHGADALLGMDVLEHCVLLVNGPARVFRLRTLNPPVLIRAPRTGATIVDDLEAAAERLAR